MQITMPKMSLLPQFIPFTVSVAVIVTVAPLTVAKVVTAEVGCAEELAGRTVVDIDFEELVEEDTGATLLDEAEVDDEFEALLLVEVDEANDAALLLDEAEDDDELEALLLEETDDEDAALLLDGDDEDELVVLAALLDEGLGEATVIVDVTTAGAEVASVDAGAVAEAPGVTVMSWVIVVVVHALAAAAQATPAAINLKNCIRVGAVIALAASVKPLTLVCCAQPTKWHVWGNRDNNLVVVKFERLHVISKFGNFHSGDRIHDYRRVWVDLPGLSIVDGTFVYVHLNSLVKASMQDSP